MTGRLFDAECATILMDTVPIFTNGETITADKMNDAFAAVTSKVEVDAGWFNDSYYSEHIPLSAAADIARIWPAELVDRLAQYMTPKALYIVAHSTLPEFLRDAAKAAAVTQKMVP